MNSNTEAIQFLNNLVSKLNAGIITFDIEGYITMINKNAIDFLGMDETISSAIDTSIIQNLQIEPLRSQVEQCIEQGRHDFHFEEMSHLGKFFVVDGVKLLDGMLITINDITDVVLSKDKATQSLLYGIEAERRRLAKEIHDGIGPSMSTIKLQIDAVKRKLSEETMINRLTSINESISEIASEIRQISHDLMPSSLIDFGLVTALTNFTNKLDDTEEIDIYFESIITDGTVNKEYELNIYRIVQELVNNSLKYANSTKIEINLDQVDNLIIVSVKDDGIGMDINEITTGIGLHNVRTRITSLQGNMTINSSVGNGVHFYIELPAKTENQ